MRFQARLLITSLYDGTVVYVGDSNDDAEHSED